MHDMQALGWFTIDLVHKQCIDTLLHDLMAQIVRGDDPRVRKIF